MQCYQKEKAGGTSPCPHQALLVLKLQQFRRQTQEGKQTFWTLALLQPRFGKLEQPFQQDYALRWAHRGLPP
ncbi:hypothetical protein DAETH_25420 [Deinococcus aetherius]|uniref:Uncharacterized protein n=1 Tax=Deinococcus aetherius TaxID=200252 RepID=A0ABM8AFX0_9DEIO|nr:hypothetical protein DAETH_25420 [Deinococcus aetherius]